MADNKVTVTFGGYDDNEDGIIQVGSQTKVDIVRDTVDDLLTLDLNGYEEGSSLVAFVKNVNNSTSGKIPYRGSFYKYDWNTRGWQQIVLGTHSHANMALLDQLGNIDTSAMSDGEEKVLTIKKIDMDGADPSAQSSNEYAYKYKLEYADKNDLPEIPDDIKGKDLFLTADKNGKFQWSNSFVPAQTFKIIKETITENILKNNSTLFFENNYLFQKNIRFNQEIQDELILFNDGKLLSDITSELKDDGLYISLNNKDLYFSEGEEITVLIIRNGIAGLLDSIKQQYLTKQDAVEILTNGAITLNGYATEKEIKKYIDEHIPTNYIRNTDYDAFDFRYADYNHTHSQYLTKQEVLSILLDASDADGDVDIDGAFETLTKALQDKIDSIDSNIIKQDQLPGIMNNIKQTLSNSDNIVVSNDGRNLTNYLNYLLTLANTTEQVKTDDVELSRLVVNLGDDDDSVGGIKNGTVFNKGTTLSQFIKALITKEKKPELIEPEFNINYSNTTLEAGAMNKFKLVPSFIENDGGKLSEISIKIYKNIEESPVYNIILNNEEDYSVSLPMNAINSTGLCYTVVVTAKYKTGDSKVSNIGVYYNLPSGEITKTIELYNKRNFIYGTLRDDIVTGENIHNTKSSSDFNTIFSYNLSEEELETSITGGFYKESLGKTFIFAVPNSLGYDIKHIYFLNQNIEMKDDFRYDYLQIPDEMGTIDNKIDNNYLVYSFTLNQKIKSDMTFKITFKKRG